MYCKIMCCYVSSLCEKQVRGRHKKWGAKLSKPRNEMKIFMFEVVLCIVRLCVVMCLHYVKKYYEEDT